MYRKGSLFVCSHLSDKKPLRPVFTVVFIPCDDAGLLRSYPSRTVDNAEDLSRLLRSAHISPSSAARLRTLLETDGAGIIEDIDLSEDTLHGLELL